MTKINDNELKNISGGVIKELSNDTFEDINVSENADGSATDISPHYRHMEDVDKNDFSLFKPHYVKKI